MSAEPSLEDLILAASEGEVENDSAVEKLAARIAEEDVLKLREMTTNFDFLMDAWDESVAKSDAKAKLCIQLAELSALDSPTFRNALNDAVRKLLPPYLSSQGAVKAVGARDSAVPVRDVALRLARLQHIRSGALVYQPDSHSWGKVITIDKVTASLGIGSLTGGSTSSLSVATALGSPSFFDPNPEMLAIIRPDRRNPPSSSRFRQTISKYALTDLSESRLKEIVSRIMVPDVISLEAFGPWWAASDSASGSAQAAGRRAPWDARSVLELHTLVSAEEPKGGVKLSPEAAAKLQNFFGGVKRSLSNKDVEMLAEAVSMMAVCNTGNVLAPMLAPLRGRTPFWPAAPSQGSLKDLETWGKLSIKTLTGFIKASQLLYSAVELAELGVRLPLRCMGPLFETLHDDVVGDAILKAKPMSPDIIMWLWKSRGKLGSRLVSVIDLNTVIEALAIDELPKEWGVAQRELKKTLFDKADFQKFVIENADGDIPGLISALQKITKIKNFQPGEQQSILVKMSRHSPELKEQFEGGEGRKLMVSGGGHAETAAQAPQAPITSMASYKRIMKELDDIIKIHMPENVAAITHARGFGDFRENAEYDAAKERRRFLNRRKAELEAQVNTVQPTDFKDVKVDGRIVLGSTVKLDLSSGKARELFIVGAWDGDPERNLISYKTKLGEVLLGAKIGDKLELPDGDSCVVKEVMPLPEDLRAKLAALGDK